MFFVVIFAVNEVYFARDFGGEFSSPSHCSSGSRMDYLWVIPRSSLDDEDYMLLLRLKKTDLPRKIVVITYNCLLLLSSRSIDFCMTFSTDRNLNTSIGCIIQDQEHG